MTGITPRCFGRVGLPRARFGRAVQVAITVAMAATALLAIPPTAEAAGTPTCANDSNWTKTDGLVKAAHPVVLVHGWTGSAMSDFRTKLEHAAGSGWQSLLFDYHDASTQWAASKDVSGCLVRYVKTVSDAHRAKGGDGIVYIVAHSMGGLATLFAANDPALAHRIGGLVSVATPYGGSPWGNANLGPFSYGKFVEALGGLGISDIPAYAAAARTCLAVHTGSSGMPSGCDVAPYLPKDVALDEIAGVLTVRRTFFGLPAYDMPMGGDTIVPVGSGEGYLGSAGRPSPTGVKVGVESVECTMDASALIAEVGARNVLTALPGVWGQLLSDTTAMGAVLAGKASPALVELLAAANVFSSCSHSGLLRNDQTVRKVVTALRAQVAWQQERRNVTTATLRTAQVPADCDLPAQRLVNGKTTKRNPGASPYAQGSLPGWGKTTDVAYGDLAGLGYKQALVPYGCGAGGVSWPEVLLLVGEQGVLLASFDLGDLGKAEHADVRAITMAGDHATVTWSAYEGAGFDIVTHTSTVRYQSGTLVITPAIPQRFTLGVDRFGPLELPTSPEVALREVAPYLGKPTSDVSGAGCELASPTQKRRAMTWGDLTLSGEYDGSEWRQITSWTLEGLHTPKPLTLPYGVTIGTSYAELKHRVAGTTVDDSHIFNSGSIIFKGDLGWWLDPSNSKVTYIAYRPAFCD